MRGTLEDRPAVTTTTTTNTVLLLLASSSSSDPSSTSPPSSSSPFLPPGQDGEVLGPHGLPGSMAARDLIGPYSDDGSMKLGDEDEDEDEEDEDVAPPRKVGSASMAGNGHRVDRCYHQRPLPAVTATLTPLTVYSFPHTQVATRYGGRRKAPSPEQPVLDLLMSQGLVSTTTTRSGSERAIAAGHYRTAPTYMVHDHQPSRTSTLLDWLAVDTTSPPLRASKCLNCQAVHSGHEGLPRPLPSPTPQAEDRGQCSVLGIRHSNSSSPQSTHPRHLR